MTITFLFNVITIQFKNYHQTFLSSTKAIMSIKSNAIADDGNKILFY